MLNPNCGPRSTANGYTCSGRLLYAKCRVERMGVAWRLAMVGEGACVIRAAAASATEAPTKEKEWTPARTVAKSRE
jgi:hypothetical protein